MSLILHFHPLSSFCHKALIAIYENGTPFEARVVDFGDPEARAAFRELSPVGKIPVLRDEARGRTLLETTIIIEYLDRHYPGPQPLFPADLDAALEARLWDRLFDLYIHLPMQKIVADRLRPNGQGDPHGVAEARATIRTAYDMVERRLADRPFAAGAHFSVADCAAAPALFYAGVLEPFGETHPNLGGYFERLLARESYARVLAEARPWFRFFPYRDDLPARFLAEPS